MGTAQRLLPACVIATLVFVLFHFFGVTDLGYDPATVTRSLFVWIARRWVVYSASQDDFPYGWAAPLVCLWMVWRLRREFASVAKRPNVTGFAVIVFALLLHWLGAKTQQTRISIAAFMLLVWGIPFYFFGWPVARRLIAPVGFLVFTAQFDFLFGAASMLRCTVAELGMILLNGLGVHARLPDATTLQAGDTVISIAKQPGGLRSVMLVMASTYLLAWMRQRGLLRQILLIASAPLVVLMASVVRTILHAIAGDYAGSFPVFYLFAVLLLLAAHKLIGRDWQKKIGRIRRHLPEALE